MGNRYRGNWITASVIRRKEMIGNCPYCNSSIGSLNIFPVNAVEGIGSTWKAAMFTCPSCRKIIGVAFDQTVHTNFIIEKIKKLLGK
jgi:uncharacterized protein with PIN domain